MAAKMARWIIKKAFLLFILLVLFDNSIVDAEGNNTSVNNTKEGPKTVRDPTPKPQDTGSSSTASKFLLVMGGIATLAAIVICCHISSKSKSNYATGGNLPKPMVDLSAKF